MVQNPTDLRRRNIIFFSKPSLDGPFFFITISNLINLFLSQFMPAMKFAWLFSRSIFFSLIFIVFSDSSKKQMVRPYTRWIVAFMTNTKRFIEWAIVKQIRIAMNSINAFFRINAPISEGIAITGPFPTTFSFYYFRPESFFSRVVNPFHLNFILYEVM